jgi:hypothetical protein
VPSVPPVALFAALYDGRRLGCPAIRRGRATEEEPMEGDPGQAEQRPRVERKENGAERRTEVVKIAVTIVDIITRGLDALARWGH